MKSQWIKTEKPQNGQKILIVIYRKSHKDYKIEIAIFRNNKYRYHDFYAKNDMSDHIILGWIPIPSIPRYRKGKI